MGILRAIVLVYIIVMLVRMAFSWMPPDTLRGRLAPINRLVLDLTEPVLAPMRRIIPPAGMFDLSFMVVFFILVILYSALPAH
ncbi:MAG TPA: YggT family protein [Acidimicrobiia bacterium]